MRIKYSLIWLSLILSLFFLSACGGSLEDEQQETTQIETPSDDSGSDDSDTPTIPEETGDALLGAELYQLQCTSCHDDEGVSPAFPLKSDSQTYSHSTDPNTALSLTDYIEIWMPVGNITACTGTCAENIAAFIRSWNPEIPDDSSDDATDPSLPIETGDAQRGEEIYQGADLKCLTCHGVEGSNENFPIDSDSETYSHSNDPNVAMTLTDYLVKWMPSAVEESCIGECAADLAAYIRTWSDTNLTPSANFNREDGILSATSTDDGGLLSLTHQWFVDDVFQQTGSTFDTSGLTGSLVIKLVSTDAQNQSSSSIVRIDFGTINQAPVADISRSANSLTATSTDDAGSENLSHQWFIDDVDKGTGNTFNTSDLTGVITIKLTSTDAQNVSASISKTFDFTTPNEAPVANFSHSGNTLTASSTDDGDFADLTHKWYVNGVFKGEGVTWGTTNFSGTKTIKLTSIDAQSLEHSTSQTIDFGNSIPVAVATADPTSGDIPLTVIFDASMSSDAEDSTLSYLWDFSDGNSSTLAKPSKIFTTAGNYTATLTVTDSAGATNTANVINIIATEPVGSGPVGDSTNGAALYASSLNCATCHGADGQSTAFAVIDPDKTVFSPSNAPNESHSLAQYINLYMPDTNGQCDSQCAADIASFINTWKNQAPTANFNSSDDTLTATSTDDGGLSALTHTWFVDDAASGTGASFDTSALTGTLTIKLTSTDAQGLSHSTTQAIDFGTNNEAPIADFSRADDTLTAISADDGGFANLSHTWFVGGVQSGTGTTFDTSGLTGSQTIKLTAIDVQTLSNSVTKTIDFTLPNEAPQANFSRTGDIFTATSTDDADSASLTHEWFVTDVSQGTGITFNAANLSGVHTIKLTSTDAQGLSHSTAQIIDFGTNNEAPIAGFSRTGDTLMATSTDDGDFANLSHIWFVGGVESGTGTTFDTSGLSGVHTIKLTSIDTQSLENSTSQTIDFGNSIPVAVATADTTSGDIPLTVMFDASMSSDAQDSTLSYFWSFSDGNSSTLATPSNIFTTVDTYAVTLTVTDSAGATNTANVINITATEPVGSGPVGDSTSGAALYASSLNCATCHGADGQSTAFAVIDPDKTVFTHDSAVGESYSLAQFINQYMPDKNGQCDAQCSADIASFINTWQNQAPTASFNSSDGTLTATSTDDGEFSDLTHTWFVDDAASGTGTSFDTSALTGTLTIKLTSTDAQGLSHSTSQAIDFGTNNEAPIADFSRADDTLMAISTDDGGFANLSHTWFVDGVQSGTGTTFDTSALSGSQTIKLTATDVQTLSNSVSKIIDFTLPNEAPQANFSRTDDIFTATSTDDSDSASLTHEWFVDDISQGTGITFNAANLSGVHTIKLTSTDGQALSNSTVQSVDFGNTLPVAIANVNITSGEIPLTVTFDASMSTDAEDTSLSYLWTFSDGTSSSVAQPSKTYDTAGNYTATLTVTDSIGATDVATTITINATAPVVVDPGDGSTNTLPAVSVVGNKVVFGGVEKSLAGYSLFWSNTDWGGENYYTAETVKAVKDELNGGIIRAAMGVEEAGGYLSSDANKIANQTRVETVVDAAIDNDMYVLIDWHTHHAEDYKDQAIAFFTEMATKYGDKTNVIYEIYNEPLADEDDSEGTWSNIIKPYALDVIAAIRAIDPDNLIIVGTSEWSQRVDQAAADPITGYGNIAYTLHFYAGTHTQYLRDIATTALTLNGGIPLFVTEWGTIEASGDGAVFEAETQLWMDFLQTNKISHLNWALNDKDEGSSLLKTGSGNSNWSTDDFTSSGTLVTDIAAASTDRVELIGGDDGGDDDGGGDGGDDDGDIIGDSTNGETFYDNACANCHGDDGQDATFAIIDPDKTVFTHNDDAGASYSLADYITLYMPAGSVDSCDAQCSADIASYIATWTDDIVIANCDIGDSGFNYGRRQMRLLTTLEYKNSLNDLIGFDIEPSDYGIPADTLVESFSNQVLTPVTQNYMDAYVSTAQAAAEFSETNSFTGVADCTGLSTSQCAELFVNDFAVKAYRRPLTDDEKTRYRSLFTGSLSEGSNAEGLKMALTAALSSPHFVYRSEMGEKVADIIDRIDNGEPTYASGNVGLTLAGADIDAGDDGFKSIPLYNNFGTSLSDFTFTDHNIVTIVAKGVESGGALPSIALRVDNKDIATVQLTSADTASYTFVVTGVNGNNKYMQVTNDINGAGHDEGRFLSIQSISFSDSVLVVEDRPDPLLDDDAYVLTQYEIATFLGYTYTGSTPDAELLLAASNKELETELQLQTQISRLLATDKARVHFGEFSAQWLATDKVLAAAKDTTLFPDFTTDIRKAMSIENREIFKHVMFDDNQPISNLFNNFSFMNNELANFYGVSGPSGETFEKVSDLSGRGGILTSGAFMAGFAHADETSPIKRAVAVRERMLCQAVPPMPTDIEAAREDAEIALAQFTLDEGGLITNRQHYAFITKDAPCSSCHEEIINPHAFGMEDFDPVGIKRTVGTNGLAIDAQGELVGTESLSDGNVLPFVGARDFSDNLQTLSSVNNCFSEKGFRFVMGTGHEYFDHIADDAPVLATDEKAGYNCAIESMNQTMAGANNNARAAFIALGVRDIVRYRKQR